MSGGDQNSKSFHAASKNRRKSNKIISLLDRSGCKFEWGSVLEHHIIDYFTHLFTSTNTNWDYIVSCLSSKVTEAQNHILLVEVEEKEVKATLFLMHPDKSPGPDKMSPGFYQKCWNIVKQDIMYVIRHFFATGVIDDQLRHTNIALIPKKKYHVYMTDLRPL